MVVSQQTKNVTVSTLKPGVVFLFCDVVEGFFIKIIGFTDVENLLLTDFIKELF